MTRRPPLHPDDHTHHQTVITQLRDLRTKHNLCQQDVANRLGSTYTALSALERGIRGDINTATICRWARALHHTAEFVMHDIPNPPFETRYTAALLAMATTAATDDAADTYRIARTVARLAAARRWYDLTLAEVGATAGGVSLHSIKHLEAESKGPPMLATLLRYARALGGHLTVELNPIQEDQP